KWITKRDTQGYKAVFPRYNSQKEQHPCCNAENSAYRQESGSQSEIPRGIELFFRVTTVRKSNNTAITLESALADRTVRRIFSF
ncbi:hypothetical protein, partial [Paenibacillus sp. N3.4]|uniref:hypothetical protein n=1 Tax=Paenibacillus sp. N3.4 TaxID=2603222 RepID=UPI001C9CF911